MLQWSIISFAAATAPSTQVSPRERERPPKCVSSSSPSWALAACSWPLQEVNTACSLACAPCTRLHTTAVACSPASPSRSQQRCILVTCARAPLSGPPLPRPPHPRPFPTAPLLSAAPIPHPSRAAAPSAPSAPRQAGLQGPAQGLGPVRRQVGRHLPRPQVRRRAVGQPLLPRRLQLHPQRRLLLQLPGPDEPAQHGPRRQQPAAAAE